MTDVAAAGAAAEVLAGGRQPIPDAAAAHLAADQAQGRCANCETPLAGAFCHACGQRAHLHSRLRDLLHEALEGVMHFDGRLWRTLPLLALNPGRLSREWRAGRRARYVAPLHLFLFAVFLLFLVPSLTGQHFFNLPNAKEISVAEQRDGSIVSIQLGDGDKPTAGAANTAGALNNLETAKPGEPPSRAHQWGVNVGKQLRKKFENPEYYGYKIETLSYKLSFLIVPMSMVILALIMVFKRGYSFYDHGVVALYGTGFFTLLIVTSLVITAVLSRLGQAWAPDALGNILLLIGAVHAYAHLKGAYALSWWGAALRTMLLGLFSVLGFAVFILGVFALGLFA